MSTESPRLKRLSSLEMLGAELFKKPKKPAACRVCHSRKVKCSGEKPCTNCIKADCISQCTYPCRDQKLTVNQSYIERLLTENEKLRKQNQNDGTDVERKAHVSPSTTTAGLDGDASPRNPMLGDGSWFVPLNTYELPIHIGEAADAAFATRFRQALADTPDTAHIPRTQYITDGRLIDLSQSHCSWPNQARARLLVKVALINIGRRHHFIQESDTLAGLDKHYQNLPVPSTFFTCKLWALFALGEAYSSRAQSSLPEEFPGLAYFARASKLLQCISERPQRDTAEVLLLLALYSLFLNRRHCAYMWASCAIRVCLIMGMHQSVPESQLSDALLRASLKRLWWSAYIIERTVASSIGLPASVQDEDIEVDLLLPSDQSDTNVRDSSDVEYLNENVRLSRLFRNVISEIYSRRPMHDPFSQRVQRALRNLRAWVESLPKQLQLETVSGPVPVASHVKTLHLTFNQVNVPFDPICKTLMYKCVILATRPILLHIFRANKQAWSRNDFDPKSEISETALALAEACIRCARHSTRLLTESWIDGSFATFDHFDTRYLFSAATVLAISSLTVGKRDDRDKDAFDAARDFLEQLRNSGNMAAGECFLQLDRMRLHMENFRPKDSASPNHAEGPVMPLAQSSMNALDANIMTSSGSAMTAEMALAEPLMLDFLSQGDLDLGFLDNQMQESQFHGSYWPMPQI